MQPQQYGNRYDFIVNPGKPPKRSLLPSFGKQSSFAQKLVLILGGALILIIIMWVVGTLIGGNGGDTAAVTKFVQQEQEIARVAQQGTEASRADIRNLAINVQLSLTSHQQTWQKFLAKKGTQIKDDQKKALQNASTDQALANAKTNNTFDKAFLDVMRSYLNNYMTTMKSSMDSTRSDTEQEILTEQYKQAQLLLEQIPKT